MEEILAFLHEICPLSPECIAYLASIVQHRPVEKDEILLDFGEVLHDRIDGVRACFSHRALHRRTFKMRQMKKVQHPGIGAGHRQAPDLEIHV